MLATIISQSATLSYWILLKKAALASFFIITSLFYGARVPRHWRREIALVSTPDQGSFAGIHVDNHVDGFFGIPYAQAPVGQLRFAKTQALPSYQKKDIRDASQPGASCLQPPVQVLHDTSEDCLFLNIYRPRSVPIKSVIPVLFYIHGGSWTLGSGSMFFYNGTALVHRSLELKEPVMVITINYRLGLFGFLGGEAMFEADKEHTAVLNAGFHDIRESLRWISQNIASFGGDPDKVTIWGESAGANAVAAQLLAKSGQTKGLFARAIMQSGSQATMPRYTATNATPMRDFNFIATAAGCGEAQCPLTCLRNVNSAHLDQVNSIAFNNKMLFSPLLDDYFVQESPSEQLRKGLFNYSVPFIHSVNLDEGTQLAAPYAKGNLTSDYDFASAISRVYGDSLQPLMQDILRLYPNIPSLGQPTRPYYWGRSPNDTFYPPSKEGSINQYKRLSSFLHDALIEAGRRQHLYAAVKNKVPVWSFRFAQPTPENSPFAKFQSSASLGVQHASDIPFVFGSNPIALNMTQQPEALRPFIADDIIKESTAVITTYWIHFAWHGNPNGPDVPYWPQFNGSRDAGSSIGQELILQPEGIRAQKDDQHFEQINFILDHAFNFNM